MDKFILVALTNLICAKALVTLELHVTVAEYITIIKKDVSAPF